MHTPKPTPCYNMVEVPGGTFCYAGRRFPHDCKCDCHAQYAPEAGEGEVGHDWQRMKLWREQVLEGDGPHE